MRGPNKEIENEIIQARIEAYVVAKEQSADNEIQAESMPIEFINEFMAKDVELKIKDQNDQDQNA